MCADVKCNALSAIADTSLLTGTGRLKIILEDMACCLMKLLIDNGSRQTDVVGQ